MLKINIEKYIEKIKKDKKSLLILISGIIVIFIIFMSEFIFTNKSEEKIDFVNEEDSQYEYCEYLEEKLTILISSIDGAGKSKVMVTLDETTEYVYAENLNEQYDINNSNYENEYVIIQVENDDKGLLIKTIEPKIRGVAIVCEGGDNPAVQQQIYSVVSSVLNLNTSKISIAKLHNQEEKWKVELLRENKLWQFY